jgi:hypothetical protein
MIMERLRRAEEQNQQLRGQIEFMAKQSGQAQTTEQQSAFEPKVAEAIRNEVLKIVKPEFEKFQNQGGMLYDEVDYVKFMQNYNKPQYSDYLEKVETVRRDAQTRGQWISREQALQLVYFQEQGKKPAPQNVKVEETKTPVFDAFLQQYVNDKGEIVQAPGTVDADKLVQQQQVQQPQMQPQPQQVQQQTYMPPQQQQMQPAHQQWVPQQGNQQPQLPSATPPEQGGFRQPGQHLTVDISSSDQALDQWEKQYGDIPL